MGLFDSLFGKAERPITDPGRLRDEMFAAAHSGDSRRLEQLARTNLSAVLEYFPSWQRVPVAVRADPAAAQGYVHAMIAIAQLFAEKLGRTELMTAFTGPAESNPIARWQSALRQSRELMDALHYPDARTLLTDALIDSRGVSGSGVDSYLPITHGYLAECHFNSGAADQAMPHLEQALALCERSGDTAGIAAYLESLFEAHRYLANPERAAGYADQMAALLDAQGTAREAARWRTRAKIVRAGEPLNRVVAVVDGATFEVDEVRPVGDIQFVFERNRRTLRPATVRTTEGEELGSAGRHEEALAAFREAAAGDPFDPHSRYQEAFTLLHVGRYADAAEGYRRVEELAPGWFQCRADLWLAEQLVFGRLDQQDFVGLNFLENGPGTPAEKVVFAEKLLKRRPILPPAHLHLGKNLARSGREEDARRALRAGLEGEPDVDVRTRLLVELGTLTDGPVERSKLFREAMAVNGNLVSAAYAALLLRGEGECGDGRDATRHAGDGALADCTKAIDIDPKHGVVCYNRGLARVAKGDLDGALADFTEAINLDPKNVNAYDYRGTVRQAKGDLDGAIADHSKAIDLDPKNLNAYYNRGNEKQAKGDLDGALADYAKAIELDPKDFYAYTNRGDARKAKGDLDGALADYTKAIDIDPKHGVIYFNRGVAREAKGDLDGAFADYTKVIDLDPKNFVAYNNRGNVRQANGDLDGAIADCTRAIDLDPNLAVAYRNRGLAKLVKADLDGAIGDYSRAIELDPKDAVAYRNRGFAKKYKNDLDGALADYTKAIYLDPKNVEAYYNRGVARVDKGDLDGALADYTKAIDLDPKHVDAYGNRGYVRYDLGTWVEALDDFRKRCELGTQGQEYPRLRIFLARARLGERIEATQELSAYWRERKSPTPVDWVTKIASFLTQLLSEEGFIKAADSKDGKLDKEQHSEAYFYMGTMSLIEGKKEKAREYFQKCLETGVKHFFEYRSAEAELRMVEKSK